MNRVRRDGIWGRRSAGAYAAFLHDAGLPPSDTLSEEGLRALRVQSGAQGAEAHPPATDVPVSGATPQARHFVAAAEQWPWRSRPGEEFIVPDASGRTALMHAAEQGNRSVGELLPEIEAGVDFGAAHGATALYMAAREVRSGIVRPLIRSGAS